MATSLKSDTCDVLVSSITVRNDQHRKKVAQVNIVLKELYKEKNLYYINHEKRITVKLLNGSKLHLNKKGTSILSNTFVELYLTHYKDVLFCIALMKIGEVVV